jgi:Cu/Ag efflux protein CusF
MPKLTYSAMFGRDRTPQQWAEHHHRVVAVLVALGLVCSYPMGVFIIGILAAPLTPARVVPARPIRAAGVVLSMNETTGAMAIQHFGVRDLNLPAGATTFRADPAVLRRTQVGDRISFDLTPVGGVYTITSAEPSPLP